MIYLAGVNNKQKDFKYSVFFLKSYVHILSKFFLFPKCLHLLFSLEIFTDDGERSGKEGRGPHVSKLCPPPTIIIICQYT